MVIHCCTKCGKNFKQKSHYKAHMKRKIPCETNGSPIQNIIDKTVDEKLSKLLEMKTVGIKPIDIDKVSLTTDATIVTNKTIKIKIKKNTNTSPPPTSATTPTTATTATTATTTTTTTKLKIIDLFSGTGAFSKAFSANPKFDIVFANDMIESSEQIYNLNFPLKKHFVLNDLHNVKTDDIPSHNILCGGFPCQPFSIAGEQKGFSDIRANIFFKIIDILKVKKPDIVILENVKNLKAHDKGNTYKVIEGKLKALGYHIKANILDTCKITEIPQHRERIYIVCFKDKKLHDAFNFDFPTIVNKQISNFLESNVDNKYYYTDKLKVYPVVNTEVTKNISENVLYQYRRYYVRENKSNCCPTLTCNMGSGGHNVPLLRDNKGVRKLTPRECFNLQGFDPSYKLPQLSDNKLYKLAGNAVSLPVVKLIVEKISSIVP